MKKISLILVTLAFFVSCNQNTNGKNESKDQKQDSIVSKPPVAKPEFLTDATFKTKVFDFSTSKKWKYQGDKPCIIDFYADWCAPCRKLAPILEELAAQYDGEIYVYKVNTDNNPGVSSYFNIVSIPTVMLCPMKGEPQMMVGLYPKDQYNTAINDVLLKKE